MAIKICLQEAEVIRDLVRRELINKGRVKVGVAEEFRRFARDDQELHRKSGDNFSVGGGPAVVNGKAIILS